MRQRRDGGNQRCNNQQCRERPRRSTTEQRDQLAPFHRDDPKPRTMRSIAGQGRASQQKRPLIVRFGSFTSHPPAANLSACPLCPRKRTCAACFVMSAKSVLIRSPRRTLKRIRATLWTYGDPK